MIEQWVCAPKKKEKQSIALIKEVLFMKNELVEFMKSKEPRIAIGITPFIPLSEFEMKIKADKIVKFVNQRLLGRLYKRNEDALTGCYTIEIGKKHKKVHLHMLLFDHWIYDKRKYKIDIFEAIRGEIDTFNRIINPKTIDIKHAHSKNLGYFLERMEETPNDPFAYLNWFYVF